MNEMIKIRKIENGFIATTSTGSEFHCADIQAALEYVMLIFEGKSQVFEGDIYAKISIQYKENTKE